jgi:L-aminopeptidase/D-esterase-like protein
VGVLVQCNYGSRRNLRIAGVPVGEEIQDLTACIANSDPFPDDVPRRRCDGSNGDDDAPAADDRDQGSIIVVVATDAPVLPHQLKRIVTRVAVGIGRQGGFGGNSSGDIFIAFSTANPNTWSSDSVATVRTLTNDRLTPLFEATAHATEAAITNALLAAETTTGANDLRIYAMPVDRMMAAMKKYGRVK